jgi:predicted aspartyl protease
MLRRLVLIGLISIAIAAPAAAQSVVRNSVGFVQGTINGKGPYWFLIDSGANRSALDDDVARELGLATTGNTEVQGAAGTVEVGAVSVARLDANGLHARKLSPTVYDLSASLAPENGKTAAILGVDALRNYAILFDIKGGRVALAPHAEQLAKLGGATIVPFEFDNGIPRIDAKIEGVPAKLRIDTGAAIGDGPALFINITDPFYRKLLAKDPTLTPYTHFTASGTGGEMNIAVVKGKIAQFGKASVDAPRYIVQPPVGYFARGDAVGFLGSYAFKTWPAFILDYPKRRLILLGPQAASNP